MTRLLPLYGVALLAVIGIGALGAALVWRGQDQARLAQSNLANCQAIEVHKSFHREEAAFDLRATRQILHELGINPDSERGQLLIERTRRNSEREQARFAPEEC